VTDPLASIVILGWGGEPYISACLEALRGQTYPSFEIIVVDNHSPDRTAEIVERDFPEVKLIRTERNLGVAGGNNVGLRAAQGDVCVLINTDVEPYPDWLEHLVRAMQSDPVIGIAGAKLLYPDGTIQFAGGRIQPPRGYSYHIGWHEPDQGQRDIFGDVDFITGASLAITRAALTEIGYEDERFFPIDYEDPDMSYRARAAGYRVVLVPNAVATHHESSTSWAHDPGRALPLEAGRLRFVCKHWPADRLRQEFLPAELDFLEKAPHVNRQTLQWVYLKTAREIADLAQWRERLGVGPRGESLSLLSEMLAELRRACLPKFGNPPSKRVAEILSAWFAPESTAIQSDSYHLFLLLCGVDGRVEPHQPIAWPEWPPGVWPKIRAVFQKLTRRLLRWYINPLVHQQNEINAVLLHAVESLAEEVTFLHGQMASMENAADADREDVPTDRAGTTDSRRSHDET
jgi:GT2 family glycosyltransferase